MGRIDSLANILGDCNINIVVKLWNSFLKEKEAKGIKDKFEFYVHDMKNIEDDMRELQQKRSFAYIIDHVTNSGGHFKTYEKFWYENEVDEFISFDLLNDYYSPIYLEELAEHIADTNPKFFSGDTMNIVDDFLWEHIGDNNDLTTKYLSIINENINKTRFITEDWDTLWEEIFQLS